ncbi:protein O-linked-mannose beta-1,2-N-acetylglucosaminyltransferase 1-like [Eriocheir sinensis]|uniref:protein O-linked-mannose beta-1,2-N-acetylglucosaminyltransferase 1-like n=1 Tax=Eriocheir sinensis TaxID=95602 RepID=UPI0021CA1052|nr:protein O-linked-mannose beta-1,2-N-acetylglucosaminyltransferase 1-like [Eriocheir sinensis]
MALNQPKKPRHDRAYRRARDAPPSCLLLLPVLLTLLGRRAATAPDAPGGQEAWEYLARLDSSLRPLQHPRPLSGVGPAAERGRGVSLAAPLAVEVHVGTDNVTVRVDGVQVYHVAGGARKAKVHFWPNSGVHLVVLGPWRQVMMLQRFLTYQPAEHLDLAAALASIQPGRVVVLAAAPDFALFLGRAAVEALGSLGFQLSPRMARGEAWAGVAITGVGVVAEGATTLQEGVYPATSLHLTAVTQPRDHAFECKWHSEPGRELQASFCRQYEGYGDFCACQRPFTPDIKYRQERVMVKEEIPVVIVTANKPRHLYRLLRNLFTIEGGGQTEVLVVVDGAHQETLALAGVMGVETLVHRPEGVHSNRTNANVRFALYSVFRQYPRADKAIVLEDDLLLSPDFLSFFHQAAWVLDSDPTVFCVNAFNSNSLPDTAADVSQLLRSEGFPMYGWMVGRSYARQVVTNWIPQGPGDWDWWLMKAWAQRNRDVVSPEVSRTFHAGNAGEHVDGFEQHLYYNRILTSTQPGTRLRDISGVVLNNYVQHLASEIQRAELVMPDPRERDFLPPGRPGPFVAFVRAGTRNDEFYSFRVFLLSTRTYYWDTREIFRGVMRLRLQGRLFYIVGCPLSELFCKLKPRDAPVTSPSRRIVRAVMRINNKYEQSLYEYGIRGRRPAVDLQEEAQLLNYVP